MHRLDAAPATAEERERLRAAGFSKADIGIYQPAEIARRSGLSEERCAVLLALSQLQSLRSVGPKLAGKLVLLGIRSICDLNDLDPHALYRRFEVLSGTRIDPCVEDVFRCAVAQARYPDLPEACKNWWFWTGQRGRSDVPDPRTGVPHGG